MAWWIVALYLPQTNALPAAPEHRISRSFGKRESSGGNEASPKIIVPVVIAVVFAVMILVVGWWKRRKRTRELINQVRATPATTNNASARTGNGTAPTQNSTPATGGDAAARPPRRRRRRRPSQISTKSLPAYNEQAGDEEIILMRRNQRESMSDDDDDEEDSPVNERRSNAASTTADARPLLDDDSSPEMPRVSLASSTRDQSVGNHESDSQSPSTANHEADPTIGASVTDHEPTEPSTRLGTAISPPLDDAPSYSEAVGQNDRQTTATPETPAPGPTPAPEPTTSSHSRQSTDGADGDALGTLRPKRKSVFRQLFTLNRTGSTSETPAESVELSSPPRPSVTLSTHSARTSANHRPSGSISTLASVSPSGRGHTLSPSLSSLILTRSRSPTRSTDSLAQRMNISAPISTTLIRTELSYPRSGPTPEQIRFLSSRESLGRFGMPYGEEAIAAARSRDNLSAVLPPQYETTSPETSNSDTRASTVTENQNTDGNISPRQVTRGPIIYTPGELALRRTESSTTAPPEHEPEQTEIDQHQEDTSNASASPQSASADLNRSPSVHSTSTSTAPNNNHNRRESVYTTHSFVTATEGNEDAAAESENYSDAESSPPTPTASTYREFGVQGPTRQRSQTVLVPESSDALHPELVLLPATPTSTISSRQDTT